MEWRSHKDKKTAVEGESSFQRSHFANQWKKVKWPLMAIDRSPPPSGWQAPRIAIIAVIVERGPKAMSGTFLKFGVDSKALFSLWHWKTSSFTSILQFIFCCKSHQKKTNLSIASELKNDMITTTERIPRLLNTKRLVRCLKRVIGRGMHGSLLTSFKKTKGRKWFSS